jgi:periplasmic copper chaperone A
VNVGDRAVQRTAVGILVAGAAVLAFAAPASAHVEPTPPAIQAGTTSELAFGVEHGCDGSPLVKVEIQVPEGVTDVEAVPGPDGWTGVVADGVVTFTGGPQPAEEPIDFSIRATFPDTPDEMVGFPTVETCEEGSISWIEPVVEGQDEPESPAPTVLLTAGAPTAEQLAPAEEDEEATTETTVGATTTSEDSDEADESDSSSSALLVAGIAVVVVALVGGGVVLARRRKDS